MYNECTSSLIHYQCNNVYTLKLKIITAKIKLLGHNSFISTETGKRNTSYDSYMPMQHLPNISQTRIHLRRSIVLRRSTVLRKYTVHLKRSTIDTTCEHSRVLTAALWPIRSQPTNVHCGRYQPLFLLFHFMHQLWNNKLLILFRGKILRMTMFEFYCLHLLTDV